MAQPDPIPRTNAVRVLRFHWVLLLAMVLAGCNVALQIGYPLVGGSTRNAVTIASVVAFFGASLLHCIATRTWRSGLGLMVFCVGGGLLCEAIGWRTGWPFGNYRYGATLGPKLLGVPMVVPLAWAMMGWPALLAGRRVRDWFAPLNAGPHNTLPVRSVGSSPWKARSITAVIGSLVLTSWDLFLDPQMVGAGHWRWLATPGPWLNGIPLVNTAGWFIVGVLMMFLLDRTVTEESILPNGDALMWLLLGWVWFSNIFGNLVFFGRPWVAAVGGAGSSLVAWVVSGGYFAQLKVTRQNGARKWQA
jgi:uncharacterized membrane protein